MILLSAVFAQLMIPHELMARSTDAFSLDTVTPRQFGNWTLVPQVRLVEPDEPDDLSHEIYTQVVARGQGPHSIGAGTALASPA